MRSIFCVSLWIGTAVAWAVPGNFRAGAYAIDVTPVKFPVLVNGMFLERLAEKAYDRIHARCLVMDDGAVRVAVAVVDSCMMSRELLDAAKEMAHVRTGIAVERMLISATHTHSAPAAMGCLGTDADPDYVRFLPGRIAEGIEKAAARLEPARAGWAVIDDFDHTHCRRWIFRPDKMRQDPFGAITVRANMHPGYQNPDAIAPSGPVDAAISLLSIQSADGKPLAVLANYSQHYFGSPIVSSDYYGLFASKLARRIGGGEGFVAIMSQGTSGDQMWMDYSRPKSDLTLEGYAQGVADRAYEAWRSIEYRPAVTLAMAETRLRLRRRAPDEQLLAWARQMLARMNGSKPRTQPEVYAREALFLRDEPVRELKLQALRVGDLGITAIPNEVFGITGLKLKARSPLQPTFNIELANGAEGYIPPPEQHKLGGYTTWPARTASLEVEAEPRIVETVLTLLEKVSRNPRRRPVEARGAYTGAVLSSRPEAYWRFSEFTGPRAEDAMGRHPATYGDGIAFYLTGPQSPDWGNQINRAVHLAGGHIAANVEKLGPRYTAEMWLWNGLPNDARGTTGIVFARGADILVLGGSSRAPGRLLFAGTAGRTEVIPKTWNQVVLVREGQKVSVYLNGKPEISGRSEPAAGGEVFIGGRPGAVESFEGKIDEVAIYRRALSAGEVAQHFRAAGSIRE